MVREASVLSAHRQHGIPVSGVLEVCDDQSVLGVPFYIMEWLDGTVLTDEVARHLDGPAERHATTRAMVHVLAQLHRVDTRQPGISALGRPQGYLERQLARFAGLWEDIGGRDLKQVDVLADWLGRNLPNSQRSSVVHGDYRLGGIMFAPGSPATPLAVLDWEMATLGDPLTDLGYMVSTYSEEGAVWNPLHMTPVTALPGYHRRVDLRRILRPQRSRRLQPRLVPGTRTLESCSLLRGDLCTLVARRAEHRHLRPEASRRRSSPLSRGHPPCHLRSVASSGCHHEVPWSGTRDYQVVHIVLTGDDHGSPSPTPPLSDRRKLREGAGFIMYRLGGNAVVGRGLRLSPAPRRVNDSRQKVPELLPLTSLRRPRCCTTRHGQRACNTICRGYVSTPTRPAASRRPQAPSTSSAQSPD
jgi:hypothetical protein